MSVKAPQGSEGRGKGMACMKLCVGGGGGRRSLGLQHDVPWWEVLWWIGELGSGFKCHSAAWTRIRT